MIKKNVGRIFYSLFLGCLLVLFLGGCKAKQKAEAEKVKAEKTNSEAIKFENEILTLATLRPIFGEAKDDRPGIYDAISSDNEIIIAYRFYTTEIKDIDDDIALDLVPKIENFYKTFKTPDRLYFGIYVARPTSLGRWNPYCSFLVTRKIMRQADWTTLILKDFFKIVQELKYAE